MGSVNKTRNSGGGVWKHISWTPCAISQSQNLCNFPLVLGRNCTQPWWSAMFPCSTTRVIVSLTTHMIVLVISKLCTVFINFSVRRAINRERYPMGLHHCDRKGEDMQTLWGVSSATSGCQLDEPLSFSGNHQRNTFVKLLKCCVYGMYHIVFFWK